MTWSGGQPIVGSGAARAGLVRGGDGLYEAERLQPGQTSGNLGGLAVGQTAVDIAGSSTSKAVALNLTKNAGVKIDRT